MNENFSKKCRNVVDYNTRVSHILCQRNDVFLFIQGKMWTKNFSRQIVYAKDDQLT